LAACVVVGILILKWIYRVDRNAHSAASGLTISPPWAVGWYFVPFATLWKPFQAVREAWQVSTQAAVWQEVVAPSKLRWWWGLWLLSNVLGQVSFRVSMMGETLSSTGVSAIIDVFATVADVALDLVFIGIVRELTRLQATNLAGIRAEAEPARGFATVS